MLKKVILINGPNLNLLGTREPDKYGSETLDSIQEDLVKKFQKHKITLSYFQSNHEGEIIDYLHQQADADYLIINPAAFTHTSVGIRDAISAIQIAFIEVHISNVYAREDFRKHSYFSDISSGVIAGCGTEGYRLATDLVIKRLTD